MAENYPVALAQSLAKLMVTDDDEEPTEVMAVGSSGDDEPGDQPPKQEKMEDEPIRKNQDLRRQVGQQVYQYVSRLHKNLGHPSPEVLLRMLEEVQATDLVKMAAKEYVCATCYARKAPSGVAPAAGLTARHFNDRVVADSAWIETSEGRKCVLTMMCQATRYIAVRILSSERASEFIKGIERAWIKQFGVPKYLRVDEAKGWASQALRDWTSAHGVTLEVAPAECHNWLGSVERHHQIVRRSFELYMDDKGLSALKEAAVYVPSQINNMVFVKGFTPNQWVTGRTPMSSTSLTAELFNPSVDPIDEQSEFAYVQQRRLQAQQAFIKADSDAKLRRAMMKNFRESKEALPCVGQRCWYWRDQGAPTLQKSRWRGPARVVAQENLG